MECKFCDEFTGVCTNGKCPMRGDCCPVSDVEGVCQFEDREEAVYKLTPKGCAIAGLMAIGAVKGTDDPAVEVFWTEYILLMKKFGYVNEVP